MWICDDCLQDGDRVFIFKSHGRCEICGETKDCWDVNIHSDAGIPISKSKPIGEKDHE
jgi:hypothetical protein